MKKNKKLFDEITLDERQEQNMLDVEHKGFWFIYWLLIIVGVVELLIAGPDHISIVAGEWIVIMAASAYVVLATLKKGLWSRKLAPTTKNNCIISLISAFACGAVLFIIIFRNSHNLVSSAIAAVSGFLTTVVLCIIAFRIIMRAYYQKLSDLEEAEEEV